MNNISEVILKATNISKQYRLGVIGRGTLGDDLKRFWFKLLQKEDPFLKVGELNDRSQLSKSSYVWALQDINFEVQRGEVLGIIGKNGAGKSTLLKILSRVTLPTTGDIKTKGRIASLLEVGTGFHPELTGLENIYLNGAILGMSKTEIRKKEAEIIEFSGCARYVNTPVKRYSSGMRVRLAFAVAAFLEPDILVIDEVLAVGDAEFQKKAVGKMQDISKGEGRTVLFVSHNMAAVKSLCSRAIVLEKGRIVCDGNTDDSVSYYLKGNGEVINKKVFDSTFGNELFQLHEISITNKGQLETDVIIENMEISIFTDITLNTNNPKDYHITYHLYNELGENMFSFTNANSIAILKNGRNKLICKIPASFLQSGQYYLSFFLIEKQRKAIFLEKDIISFIVIDQQREIGIYMGREPGYIKPNFDWELI